MDSLECWIFYEQLVLALSLPENGPEIFLQHHRDNVVCLHNIFKLYGTLPAGNSQ